MSTFELSLEDSLPLRLAADARQTRPSYVDDQIWELTLKGGDPQAMAIETSYGLRAQRMRIYPGFTLGGGVVLNPDQFVEGPTIQKVFPNYSLVECRPFDNLSARIEYWVMESNLLLGRFQVTNQSGSAMSLGVRLYAQLRVGERGEPMGEWQFKAVTSLIGRAGDLAPVIFITGGAKVDQSIYPSLIVGCELERGESKSILWAHAGYGDHVASFEAARAAVQVPWDAEIAKLELLNRSMIEIETGDPTWDVAFSLTQKIAIGAYVGPTKFLPHPSFVNTRTAEYGYSTSGDGSDYAMHWDGQSVLLAYAHLPLLATLAPELAKGVIRNFLSVQRPDGFVDWKPGLGGQRKESLSAPLLASLTWMIYEHTQDRAFLEETIDGLQAFLELWFDEKHDRDGDGFPEWDHTIQMGYADCPTFTPWKKWGQGLDISKVETPDLAAFLVKECKSLIRISVELGKAELIAGLEDHIDRLSNAVEQAWDEQSNIYRYIDRDTHLWGSGEELGSGEGEFVIQLDREFEQPVRILIRAHGEEGLSHTAQIFIHGRGKKGRHRVEKMRERNFHWFWGIGTATSEKTYVEIERIEVRGFTEAFQSVISIADYGRDDTSLLLPLWAEIPDKARAKKLIEKTLLDESRFYRPNGVANCSIKDPAYEEARIEGAVSIDVLRNILLGEGLLGYGYRKEAADLVQRVMDGITSILKSEGSFRESYDPEQARGFGEKDHLAGLAPLTLFLKTLGVQLISQHEISVRGSNPFPWPVTLRWKGLVIDCMQDRTIVEFPDGGKIEISGDDRKLIEQAPN
ncbi:MAG: hypothetical protein KAH97_00275 [Anaerolineales bacterium]|nr:hypothetical protein [Anaerolineales bacterium]